MTRTLFIGDSHAHGYYEIDNKISAWQDNNYAEIYADENNKQEWEYYRYNLSKM